MERWRPIVALIDAVTSDPVIVDRAVRDVQAGVAPVARLPPEDVARHTRALLMAAVRAIAERRGPSAAELDFIEGLAVARARQQVPIEAVLAAVHLAGRQVWAEARRLAEERQVPLELLVDARDLYDDWAEQVRGRLLVAHRDTELARARSLRDRRGELLRRVLDGGPVAAIAAAEAGLDGEQLLVAHAGCDDEVAASLEASLRTDAADLFGRAGGALVGVLARDPGARDDLPVPVGLAGPAPVEELDRAARWARWAHDAGVARGRRGLCRFDDAPAAAALASRPELAAAAAARLRAALADEGPFAAALEATACAHLDGDLRVEATAAALHVHPNTVRHRLRRLRELTGFDVTRVHDAVTVWWALRTAPEEG